MSCLPCVDDTPTKNFRIGKFDEKKTAPRLMKVIMETCEAQNKVMSNLKKLSTAEHLKDLSISYDMTNQERALVKHKVEEAKEKKQKLKKLGVQNKRPLLEPTGNKNPKTSRRGQGRRGVTQQTSVL